MERRKWRKKNGERRREKEKERERKIEREQVVVKISKTERQRVEDIALLQIIKMVEEKRMVDRDKIELTKSEEDVISIEIEDNISDNFFVR